MARDDFEVIAYKILAYFNECTKAGKRPQAEDFCCSCEMFQIPESYWIVIMRELLKKGYLSGIHEVQEGQTVGFKVEPGAAITLDGVEYLKSNSLIAKAREMLGLSFETVLSRIIATI